MTRISGDTMTAQATALTCQTMPVGIVVQRRPGVTKWARWSWTAVSVLPGAGLADWRVLHADGDTTLYHAATLDLELHAAEAEAYLHGLCAEVPCVYVVLNAAQGSGDTPLEVMLVTASPHEAQDYADSGEEIVEKVAMPPAVEAWVRDFVEAHHRDEPFRKRRRDRVDIDRKQDGVGDPRIHQMRDVYRAPRPARKGAPQ